MGENFWLVRNFVVVAFFVFSEGEKVIEGCCMKFFRFIEERFVWKWHSFQGRFPMVLETAFMQQWSNDIFEFSMNEIFVERVCMKIPAGLESVAEGNHADFNSVFQWFWISPLCRVARTAYLRVFDGHQDPPHVASRGW